MIVSANMLYSVIVAFAICVCIWIFFIPFHVKYNKNIDKKSAINRARKLKKIGSKIPPPFPNGWFAIASSNEIKAGKAKNIDCLGENFVVFRSQSEEVFILDAYCPHMGANLGVGGIVTQNCIECPFHQWKFNGEDGSLDDVPYSENFSELEKVARVRKWVSREANGLIFVWYHAENGEPWDLPSIDTESMRLHGSNEFIVHSHIQDIPENGADRAHLATVHGANIFAGSDIRYIRNSYFSIGSHIWDAKWSVDEENRHIALVSLTHAFEIFSLKFIQIDTKIRQIGPGFVVLELKTFFGPIIILQTLTPIEPLVQCLSHYFFASPWLGWYLKFCIWGETVNVARDVMIWDYKQFLRHPLLAKEEKQIKSFRNWYGQFYSENSKTFASASNNNDLEW